MKPAPSPFVIAEAGVNHNGLVDLAKSLVDAAVAAGADAVKFQTFKAERVVSLRAPKAPYQRETTSAQESQWEMLKRLELSPDAHKELALYCRSRGILFLSTPFDAESADFLEALGVPLFKIPSGELTHLSLLRHVARKGKPLLLSTGMSYLGEVERALEAIRSNGNPKITLLHCVSSYPAPPEQVNLRAMRTLREAFGLPVGLSDHTQGYEIALAAAALGACVIEKHFTLSRDMDGPDHRASLEPQELAAMVRGIRKITAAMGDGIKRPQPAEEAVRSIARRSLVAAVSLPAGTVLEERHLEIKRPGTGLSPELLGQVVGRRVNRPLDKDEVLEWGMLT